MLPSKCGGFGGVNEAKPGGREAGKGGLEGMHQCLLFGYRCVIPINLKAGMQGVSREGSVFMAGGEVYAADSDEDGPPGLSKVIWFYVRREV